MKCSHINLEVHDYRPAVSAIGVRCVECHAVMEKSAKGKEWHRMHRYQMIPIERRYFKEFVLGPPVDRMEGYKNHHVVRR